MLDYLLTLLGMSIMGVKTRDTLSILKHMEESFGDEITAFYYMNLHNDSDIRVVPLNQESIIIVYSRVSDLSH